jgi:broad specificity phosphatase PhoE
MKRKQVSVFFVRHGEAAHNIFEHGFYTRDNQLSAHGRRQAVACGNVLRSIAQDGPFDRAIVSPMRRTIETCLLSLEAMDGSKSYQMPEIILEVLWSGMLDIFAIAAHHVRFSNSNSQLLIFRALNAESASNTAQRLQLLQSSATKILHFWVQSPTLTRK